MSEEPLIAVQPPHQMQILTPDVPRETPSAEQQAAADEVFTDGHGQAVAALMAVQTGVGLAYLIADNSRAAKEEKPRVPPRDLREE
ncbi:MAG: hypothetical protein ACRC33_06975 [Gemmataceae bacterium]